MSDSPIWPPGNPTSTDSAVRAAVAAWADTGARRDHAAVLAAVVHRVADAVGLTVPFELDGAAVIPDPVAVDVEVPREVLAAVGPWLPGLVREAVLDDATRARGGVHHTAPAVADAIVGLAASARPLTHHAVVLDPAVGGGAFLLATAARLPGAPAERVARLRGVDLDPLAVAVTRAALRLWAGGAPVAADAIRVGDGLFVEWDTPATHVVGNPPFGAQLRGETVRGAERRTRLRARWPELGGYVDDAAAFLLAGIDRVDADGVVALIQPTSVLAARDAGPVRERIVRDAPPVAVWLDGGRRFAAAVDTVGLVLAKGAGATESVRRFTGVPAAPLPPVAVGAASWSQLLLRDAPRLDESALTTAGAVADVAAVTAGFRAEFYGLREAVGDDPDAPYRLLTSGLIDPLDDRWGRVDCRFDRRRWRHPGVDPDRVDPAIAGWVRARLVPKLLVASQTKTIEVVVDPDGSRVPCTPVVSVEPGSGAPSLAHLAAALTSPVTTRLLLRAAAGTALSAEAMRVTASGLAALPLPGVQSAWDVAAALVERRVATPGEVSVAEIGRATLAAYGVAERDDLLEWWRSRLPCR